MPPSRKRARPSQPSQLSKTSASLLARKASRRSRRRISQDRSSSTQLPTSGPSPDLPRDPEHGSDMDSQTNAFLQQVLTDSTTTTPHLGLPKLDPSLVLPSGPHTSSGPPDVMLGHLVASLPKHPSLSNFLNQPWHGFLPPAWQRVKGINPPDPASLGALSTALMAALGLVGRLTLANVISPTAALAFLGRMADAGFGREGTSKCRYLLDSIPVEAYAATVDGRIPDRSLAIPGTRCLPLIEIFARFPGFLPPPVPPSSPSRSKGAGAGTGKGKGKGRSQRSSDEPDPTPDQPRSAGLTDSNAYRFLH
ncbi:hypothetical protein Pmar_PMAR025743 [Perkinsus marinus ATCC 50983]|uniref:Uncharacterized protein n=1 Tax=Perkinsus marinus (strain ATCC 50983 / TXsc) TaxID=423536 RepID=C5LKP0_PERM5|nr:hypothetical protein Pmar_PMAR025743 [Perkinsus marinus ATCC 50983]EER02721.1 hypothetical protein Pmar_PMAR025743 [Perkinsus marinus ATCC 50983]|eukprot:XP_002770716.1 hypothetical protein Pmar_PMAR025743 [Perkinsus marinus ATCC 50983]